MVFNRRAAVFSGITFLTLGICALMFTNATMPVAVPCTMPTVPSDFCSNAKLTDQFQFNKDNSTKSYFIFANNKTFEIDSDGSCFHILGDKNIIKFKNGFSRTDKFKIQGTANVIYLNGYQHSVMMVGDSNAAAFMGDNPLPALKGKIATWQNDVSILGNNAEVKDVAGRVFFQSKIKVIGNKARIYLSQGENWQNNIDIKGDGHEVFVGADGDKTWQTSLRISGNNSKIQYKGFQNNGFLKGNNKVSLNGQIYENKTFGICNDYVTVDKDTDPLTTKDNTCRSK